MHNIYGGRAISGCATFGSWVGDHALKFGGGIALIQQMLMMMMMIVMEMLMMKMETMPTKSWLRGHWPERARGG